MESMALSHTSDGESERTPDSDVAPTGKGFSITPKDASILKGHLDEFQTANTETRNRILEMAMGELYALRPSSTIFDKKEAKRVSLLSILGWTPDIPGPVENPDMVLQPL